ncbi:hypothetical protein QE177_01590 [Arsenophonus sp. aPb]|uniref:hypothetical protein n=1 Tax=Arsenophonus sp. aPb TaxID=3041619 RepID=UPI0024695C72|nr:hypothetical protein [Arsenophonus sp. aPb]WGL98627.1 hypothetical protein QE177_01590 [Arsenophonus sp. aPb]
MNHSHCICPKFMENYISNPFFSSYLVSSGAIILIDNFGILECEYYYRIKENSPENFEIIKAIFTLLRANKGKLLECELNNNEDNKINELMFQITKNATTTFNKSYLAYDNNDFTDYLEKLKNKEIHLFNFCHIQQLWYGLPEYLSGSFLSYTQLNNDIQFILNILSRKSYRAKKEDELNDFVKEKLELKKYVIRDQTREGKSQTGNNSGELDLIILNRAKLYCIIEAMKLKSLNVNYINSHYKKLIIDYNPSGVRQTILIIYYIGNNFHNFSEKYNQYIRSIDVKIFNSNNLKLGELEEINTSYANLRQFKHCVFLNKEPIFCNHYLLNL